MPNPTIRATLYALTDRGLTREHNEDTFLVADLGTPYPMRASERIDHEVGPRGLMYLVADGMGGAAAGELASEMAAVTIHRHMVDVWGEDLDVSEGRFVRRLREAVETANGALHSYATEHADVRGMGTTATVAGVWGERLYLAQIGDSRGYLVRNGETRQLTRDQSLTQRLVEVGELTEEEAEQSARRNIILQALGPDPKVKVDMSWQALQRGDLLIICSDGLSSVVRKADIAQVATPTASVESICADLVALANERGGPDNITVVAVRFDGDGLPEVADDEPGYHEFLTTDEVPALALTAAIPAIPRPEPPPPPARRGSPTGVALLVLAVALGLVAVAMWLRAG
ncbi:MAG TPA: protein phosphatase 2C domain-containing protein [Gemmatimonadales bacterium]|nr:protein phosphatase 2C domain-containing protein [Gemmatimonadales bacterium]